MSQFCRHYLEIRGPRQLLHRAVELACPQVFDAWVPSYRSRVLEGESTGFLLITYGREFEAGTEHVQAFVEQFSDLTATLLWHEGKQGLRGYGVWMPESQPVLVREEWVDLAYLPRLFPDSYPMPLGAEAWAAASEHDDVLVMWRERMLLETGRPYIGGEPIRYFIPGFVS